MTDPRWYQIAVLGGLLTYGLAVLDFDVPPAQVAVTIGACLGTQWLGTRLASRGCFDAKSALISGLSLCLLLRTSDLRLAALAGFIAIGTKFAVRVRGKHVFNPTNVALVAVIALTESAWVSPGQWGTATFFAFLMACLGTLVVTRAARADVTLGFLGCYAGLMVARALWLGDPLAIPLHRLQNGALLLFAFFMISDPKTTPDTRAGRLLFAALVAFGAWYVHFRLFRTNGLLWSLALWSMAVPLIDRWLPGVGYTWPGTSMRPGARSVVQRPLPLTNGGMLMKRRLVGLVLAILATCALSDTVRAFCGFYVARADTKIFNRASQVVLVRDGDRTVLTMANDFRGDPKEFAVVIPVPTFIERGQIHVGDKALIDHLDAYTAPRLVEYFDGDPCELRYPRAAAAQELSGMTDATRKGRRDEALGVRIEASYTVGEYEILILSAAQSSGLATWLRENGYRLPDGADAVLGSYIRQSMRFFVARVNLKEQARLGFTYLRPLQVAYESPKFVLPIRLGTLNADGPQELFIYALTRKGRVETTNYRTVRLPTGMDLPVFVKQEFPAFYKSMFAEQVRRERMSAVFLEYAWDMSWCDPCAADPLSLDELRQLGVFWLAGDSPSPDAVPGGIRRPVPPPGGPVDVFVTRLHVRYDGSRFPEDLVFQETGDRQNFQGRYVLRHPWTGEARCAAAAQYRADLAARFDREAETLATLTGWPLAEIRRKMPHVDRPAPAKWWERLWGG